MRAVNSYHRLKSTLRVRDGRLLAGSQSIPVDRFRAIKLLSVGKASVPMLIAALETFRGREVSGILVAPKGEKITRLNSKVEVFRSGHPFPDQRGIRASRRVISFVDRIQKDELLICLISGGASALLPAPAEGITLNDKITVTNQLLRSRATIHEINTVRRHLSRLKGGRLVERCRASTILSFIVSDVPGNSLPDIGSGLTVEDPTTFQDAVDVLNQYGIWRRTSQRVRKHLGRGLRGELPDTPKPGSVIFRRVRNIIIADRRTACLAAKRAIERKGMSAIILGSEFEMEARSLGKFLASLALGSKKFGQPLSGSGGLIVGGEATVEVKGRGLGGRNQEVALAAVNGISGLDGTVISALATDGLDGNSPAAGAIVDGKTLDRTRKLGLDPQEFAARNDSYRFFHKLQDNLVTGQTGTNVADLYLIVSIA